MTVARSLLLTVAAASLAACSDVGSEDVADSARFAELVAASTDLAYQNNIGIGPTEAVDVPVSGSATFEGFASFTTKSDYEAAYAEALEDGDPFPRDIFIAQHPAIVSDLTMTADFEAGTIEGRAHDFEGAGGAEVEGELAIANGRIDPVDGGPHFEADLDGTLTEDGTDVAYDGEFIGHFVGDDAQGLRASGEALATSAAGEEIVYGVISADR